MPELSCVPAARSEFDINDSWGELITPLEELKIPTRFREYLNILPQGVNITVTKINSMNYSDEVKCQTLVLPLEMAYQLRDFLNKNLDDYAWRLAEAGFLPEKRCKALTTFKKVYYEDEINNINKSEETDTKEKKAEVSK